jgi:probable HAF family extracellular repeat protein
MRCWFVASHCVVPNPIGNDSVPSLMGPPHRRKPLFPSETVTWERNRFALSHHFLEVAMQARSGIVLFLLSLSLAAAKAGPAYPEYRLTVMAKANSWATDINSSGVVVGYYPTGRTTTRGFLNRGTGMVDLGTLGGTTSNAVAINDRGEVLGNWTTRTGQNRGFIYYHGRQRDIGVIPGMLTSYSDINNAGYVIAGGSLPDDSLGTRSFLRSPDGHFTDIGHLPLPPGYNPLIFARALNNRNQITGESGPLTFPDQPYRAFAWFKGVMRDLGDFGGEPNGGLAINDRGQITGYVATPATGFRNETAFLYSNGRLVDIDGRPATEERFSMGTGINNHGHIVGTSSHLSGFIYRGRRMESLNALIDPRLGWNIRFPEAINDAGQIAATAYRNGVPYAVRLDLIRPSALAEPELETDEKAGTSVEPLSPAQAAAEARAEAEAVAREVVHPVR